MTRTGEQGVALVITLFLMGAMSALAVSMMFLAQTETSASRNYRTMSQARYAGEAGVHRALHYLSSSAYAPTVVSLAPLNTSVSPVTFAGSPVVLAPVASDSNHPDNSLKNEYAALFSGASLSVGGGATVTYAATATLLSARAVSVYGGTTSVVQTWRIAAVGTAGTLTLPATVEVAAILERDSAAAETYAIFATGGGCGAITMSGDVTTDSYDSTSMTLSGGVPVTQASGGAVGTNGNLNIGGQVLVNGNLDTPRTGVGACNAGTPTALTGSGQATVTGEIVQLPQAKVYPAPAPPSPLPPTTSLGITSSTDCLELGLMPPAICSGLAGNLTITANGATISLGNVAMTGGSVLTIESGLGGAPVNLNVNTFSMAGNSTIALGTGTSVVMNVAGQGVTTGTVLDFTGGSFTNGSFDPSKFQILYAGAGEIKMTGGSQASGTIYAPNSYVVMSGSAGFYGSILANTFRDIGGASVHYDRSLASKFSTLGQHVMSSFSWQKY